VSRWRSRRKVPAASNALADQLVDRDVQERSAAITAAHVEAAKETIILERRTHLDSLVARLREPRVRRILDPMLAGERVADDVLDDDFYYVLGLGLIRQRAGRYEIANPIYREVIPRALTHVQQMQIPNEPPVYVRADGSLDVPTLMTDWQAFWRIDGHPAAEGFAYRESGPHLMLMAFLRGALPPRSPQGIGAPGPPQSAGSGAGGSGYASVAARANWHCWSSGRQSP
jgi:hypothetical protein